MTAATSKRSTQKWDSGVMPHSFSLGVKAATSLYQGTIVCADSTGYAVAGAVSTTQKVLGVAQADADNASGSSGAINVEIKAGVFQFANSAAADEITQAEVGSYCYIVDNQTVAKTDNGGTRIRCGKIMGVDSAGVWVAIHPYGITADVATLTGSETLTNKTLTTPTIASFANATHTHANAANGGLVAVGGVTPGTAYQALRTNSGATATEMGGRVIGGAAVATFTAGALAIVVTGGQFRYIDATDQNSTLTVNTTGAVAGDYIHIVRATAGAHTVAVVNGGAGAGTLMTMTASKKAGCNVGFDGTNWRLISAYQEP